MALSSPGHRDGAAGGILAQGLALWPACPELLTIRDQQKGHAPGSLLLRSHYHSLVGGRGQTPALARGGPGPSGRYQVEFLADILVGWRECLFSSYEEALRRAGLL